MRIRRWRWYVAQPFLALPPPVAYIAFSVLAAIASLLALYGLDLLPRADRLQVYLLVDLRRSA